MTNNIALVRSVLIYAICVPLAIVLGYMVSDSLYAQYDYAFGVVLFLLVLPLLLRWYHSWLIVVWNMGITCVYIPGFLPGWMPVTLVGFSVAVGHYILNRDRKFLQAPAVSRSLVFLAIVVAMTAMFRGGIGFHAFGSEAVGGKRYLWMWVAILGYFTLISQPIPPEKRKRYTILFLLGSGTLIMSEIAGFLGPAANFIYIFFPGGDPDPQQMSPVGQEVLQRFAGVAAAGMAIVLTLVARYGIEGVLDLKRFWRPVLFFSALFLSALGGFRSIIILIGITLILVFIFEGLVRSRLMPVVILGILLMGGLVVSFSNHLPLAVQRCLAIFPVKIDPEARLNAEASTEWRLEIWQYLLPQVPRYLFLGKGLTFDVNDMAMYYSLGNQQVGGEVGGQLTLAGDYHNGPLSVIIPFGIWGVIGFVWFLIAGIQVLWRNYKYGDPDLKRINTFLFCYFIAKSINFIVIFGGLYSELFVFVGLVGFSISLNGGVGAGAPAEVRPQMVFKRFRPLPSAGPVAGA